MDRSHVRTREERNWLGYLSLSAILWFGMLQLLGPPDGSTRTFPDAAENGSPEFRRVSLLERSPSAPMAPEEDEPEDEVLTELDGQLVDVPRPVEEERPTESDYLAEYDRTVERETRSPDFRINPEVLADRFSPEDQIEQAELEDMQETDPSTGAQVGNNRFDLEEHGSMAAVPHPYSRTNLEGLERPALGGSLASEMAGAPNNDLVVEESGDGLRLNTRELLGAEYLNRIRREVNFYWDQNLDNLPRSVIFVRPVYVTGVDLVLDGNGAVESIVVDLESGSGPLDNAVVHAIEIAGPFPNPPAALIEADGRIRLSDTRWHVNIGQAQARYMGIDPRQDVQFPGILRAPR